MTALPMSGPRGAALPSSGPSGAARPADGWPMRVVRAGVFASSSVALAVGAHRLGGGVQPARDVVLAAAALLFGLGLVWSRRERRGASITAVVLLSQLAAHAAFALAPMPAMAGNRAADEMNRWAAMLLCDAPGHPATAAQVNAARAALGLGPLPLSAPTMHMASPLTAGGAGMLAMHLSAALVMAWWLRRGERAAWTAARRVVAIVVSAGQHALPVPATVAAARAVGVVRTPRRWTFGAGLAGRGPPRVSASVLTA